MVIVIAAIAGFISSKQYFKPSSPVEYKSLLVYPQAKAISGFKLTDKNSQTISIDDFAEHWTLLFFGFTSCPDVCPTTLTELQKVYQQLESKIPNNMPKVLFVSVDADRDTPEVLNNYVNFFNPHFDAASADAANLIALTTQIGVAYHVQAHQSATENYSVDHSASIFVINPDKKLYGIFPTPHIENHISHDLIQLISTTEWKEHFILGFNTYYPINCYQK